ncbi:MAG: helix-turn-helix domain-containing protein [Candidatus Aenigmatarchaeota archaeon]
MMNMKQHREKKFPNQTETLVLYLLNTKYTCATTKQLAKEIGLSESYVRKILSRLKERGWVDFIYTPPTSFRYKWWRINAPNLPRIEPYSHQKIHYSIITLEQLKQISPHIEKIENQLNQKKERF